MAGSVKAVEMWGFGLHCPHLQQLCAWVRHALKHGRGPAGTLATLEEQGIETGKRLICHGERSSIWDP